MKLVTITQEFVDIFDFPTEIMSKDSNGNDRPFIMLLSLLYRGQRRIFALPFRSNIQINKNTKGTYFALPKRFSTKEGHAHGLHYIKIFPLKNGYYNKYNVPNTKYDSMLMKFISKNQKAIVAGAQQYLAEYENGVRHKYCTDIDRMIDALDKYEATKQIVAETTEQVAPSPDPIEKN